MKSTKWTSYYVVQFSPQDRGLLNPAIGLAVSHSYFSVTMKLSRRTLHVRYTTTQHLTFSRHAKKRKVRRAQASELPRNLIRKTTPKLFGKGLAFDAIDSGIGVEPPARD